MVQTRGYADPLRDSSPGAARDHRVQRPPSLVAGADPPVPGQTLWWSAAPLPPTHVTSGSGHRWEWGHPPRWAWGDPGAPLFRRCCQDL